MGLLDKNWAQLLFSILFLVAFLLITFSVVSNGYAVNFDRTVNELAIYQENLLTFSFFTGLTYLASTTVIIILSAVLLFFLIYRKRYGPVFLLMLILGGGAVLEFLVKNIVHRARPIGALVEASGYSFPSGHALKAVLFFSLLIYFFKDPIKNKIIRRLFVFANVVLVLLVGLSRVYLRVHWTSDVMGGFLLGLFWFFFSVFLYEKIWK